MHEQRPRIKVTKLNFKKSLRSIFKKSCPRIAVVFAFTPKIQTNEFIKCKHFFRSFSSKLIYFLKEY